MDLRAKVVPWWQDYIDARLLAYPTGDDREPLERCLEWVTRYAVVDGVPGSGHLADVYAKVYTEDNHKAKRKRK